MDNVIYKNYNLFKVKYLDVENIEKEALMLYTSYPKKNDRLDIVRDLLDEKCFSIISFEKFTCKIPIDNNYIKDIQDKIKVLKKDEYFI